MEYSTLHDLITYLEYGTNLHISVVFLNNYGNYKTKLPQNNTIHSKEYCNFMKALPGGAAKCVKCRNTALNKVVLERESFGGLCFNGVYEYCYPVIYDGDVIAVIFVGNIMSENPSEKMLEMEHTFEKNFEEEKCKKISKIVSNHIKLLISEYSNVKTEFNPLIANIISYLEESIYSDISVKEISEIFSYNEKYIGKLFKKHTGKTMKEYVNDKRIKKSVELLINTDYNITEIAVRCGFNNVTYFNKLFKIYAGVSPVKYRNERHA